MHQLDYISNSSVPSVCRPFPPQKFKPEEPIRNAPVSVDRQFGARVVNLASLANKNTLDIALVKALRLQLERLESNPAVTIVILQGATEGVFCSGSDIAGLAALAKGEGHLSAAAPEARKLAMGYLQEQYRLHHVVATYTKPVVASMHGVTAGTGFSLAQNAEYVYSSENGSVSLPEVSSGLTVHGGASYHLARMQNGTGMYAALTGDAFNGQDAYWAGLSNLHGTTADLRERLSREAGAVSGTEHSALDMRKDPTYIRAMTTLRGMRAESKIGEIASHISEDVATDVFDEYMRLKRWYSYWVTGDKESAEIAREDGKHMTEYPGDLFDLHESPELHQGRQRGAGAGGEDHPGSYSNEPKHAAAERRARIGAVSAHAAAILKGADNGGLSESGPSAELVQKLALIQHAFGGIQGDVTSSNGVLTTASASAPSVSTASTAAAADTAAAAAATDEARRKALIASLESKAKAGQMAPLSATWETSVLKAKKVPELVIAAYEHMELDRWDLRMSEKEMAAKPLEQGEVLDAAIAPNSDAAAADKSRMLKLMSEAVREGVMTAWPTGQMREDTVQRILGKYFGTPKTGISAAEHGADAARAAAAAAIAHDERAMLLRVATARVTAAVHHLPPYSLADGSIVTRARRINRRPIIAPQDLKGPSDYKIPAMVDTIAVDEELPAGVSSGASAGGAGGRPTLLSVNPRIFTDPDGFYYDFREEEDFWWPYTAGRWTGDMFGHGHTDNLPITPDGAFGVSLREAPLPATDGAGIAIAALRTDVVRLLHVATPASGECLASYTATVASYTGAAASASSSSSEAELAALRSSLLDGAGRQAFAARLTQLRQAEESLVSGESEADVAPAGDQERRALAHVAWPAMASTLQRMRVVLYEALADQALGTSGSGGVSVRPSATDIDALARLAVDTPEGYEYLLQAAEQEEGAARKRSAASAPGVGENTRLLNTWLSILNGAEQQAAAGPAAPSPAGASSPAARGPSGRGPAGHKPRAASPSAATRVRKDNPFQTLPVARFTEERKAELLSLATTFAKWEASVLGNQAGGEWIEVSSASAPKASPRYTLASTIDAESRLPRLTLVRADVKAAAPVAAAAGTPGKAAPAEVDVRSARAAIYRSIQRSQAGQSDSSGSSSSGRRPDALAGMPGAAAAQSAVAGLEAGSKSPEAHARDLQASGSTSVFADFQKLRTGAGAAGGPGASSLSSSGSVNTAVGGKGTRTFPVPEVAPMPATEAAATAEMRSEVKGEMWDFDLILSALSDESGRGIVRIFKLPETARTLGAGTIVTDHFRKEADGRVAAPQARSVGEIKHRLSEVIGGRWTAARSSHSSSGAGKTVDGATSAMAKSMLDRLTAAPVRALDVTHALISAAASAPLDECMRMEYRAMARLLGAEPVPAGASPSSFLAPLSKPELELSFSHRGAATALKNRRARQQAAWERSFEVYLSSGEAGGVIGDMFRRRYVYFKNPLGDMAFGADATAVVEDDVAAADREGRRDVMELAREHLDNQRDSGSFSRASADRFGDESKQEEQAAMAVHMALENGIKRVTAEAEKAALAAAMKTAAEYSTASAAPGARMHLSPGEQRRFASLTGVPAFLQ